MQTETVNGAVYSLPSLRGRSFSPSIFSGLVALFDVIAIFGSGVLIYLVYQGWSIASYPPYLIAAALQTLGVTLSLYVAGLYRFNSLSHPLQPLKRVVASCLMVFVTLVTLAFMLKISDHLSRVWAFSWLLSSMMLLCLGRLLCHHFLLSWSRSGRLTRNIAVVGGDEQARRLLQHITLHSEPWNRVVGVFDDRLSRSQSRVMDYPVLGSLDGLLEFARNRRIDDVVVTLPWSADKRLRDIIGRLRELPVNIHLGADLAGYMYPQLSYSSLGGVPMLSVAHKPKPNNGWNVVLKYLEDKFVASVALLLAAPVMLVAALAIKLDSPGPVLFRQPRYGFNNKVFHVYKFRTMSHRDNPDLGGRQATRNDPRITRVGHFLRRTSIDELPQLFNVLQGSMSLVGPRPHPVALNDHYAALIGGYLLRHRVKPGITGWAQVCGHRGETEVPEKMRARVEHDIYYIENWSLWLDLQILTLTAFVGFVNKNAY